MPAPDNDLPTVMSAKMEGTQPCTRCGKQYDTFHSCTPTEGTHNNE